MLLRHEGFRRLCRARERLTELDGPQPTIEALAREVGISPYHFIFDDTSENASGSMHRIKLTSIVVDDQEKAQRFYTDVLGFAKCKDIPVGEFARLSAKGVTFTQPPTAAGPVILAVFADRCGNLIQLYQPTR